MSAETLQDNNETLDSLYQWTALAVIVIGTFMVILDSSIVNVAIPKMMSVFGVSVTEAKWFVTAYTLTMGAMIPLTGYMAHRFGPKRVYMGSMFAFTVGSFFCGLAWNHQVMIAARVVQAIGGGMISPVAMTIIYAIFPIEKRGMALGFWGIAAMAAPTIGPTLGGYIIEALNWHMIFYINIPIGIVGIILSWIILKPTPGKKDWPFDPVGFITVTIGMVSCLYVLGEGSSIDWGEVSNILLLTMGFFCLILFVINELYHPHPMLDIRILKYSQYTLSILITSVLNMALFGFVFIMPLFLQNLRGLTAMQTGILMFPSAMATGIMMPLSGRLYDKLGAKKIIIPGLTLLVFATWLLSGITPETPLRTIMWYMVIRGIGMGIAFMPITTEGMNSVPPEKVAEASALSNTVRQIAGSLSVTILTTMMSNYQTERFARLIETVNPFNATVLNFTRMLQGYVIAAGGDPKAAYSYIALIFQQQAFADSIGYTLTISTIIAIVTIPLTLLLKGSKKDKATDREVSHESIVH